MLDYIKVKTVAVGVNQSTNFDEPPTNDSWWVIADFHHTAFAGLVDGILVRNLLEQLRLLLTRVLIGCDLSDIVDEVGEACKSDVEKGDKVFEVCHCVNNVGAPQIDRWICPDHSREQCRGWLVCRVRHGQRQPGRQDPRQHVLWRRSHVGSWSHHCGTSPLHDLEMATSHRTSENIVPCFDSRRQYGNRHTCHSICKIVIVSFFFSSSKCKGRKAKFY